MRLCDSMGSNSFTALNILRALSIHPSLSSPLAITNLFVVSIVFPLTKCHIVGITEHVAFQISFFHIVINMHWRFLYVFSELDSSFPFSVNIPLSGWTTVYVSNSPAAGYLDSFQALASRNNTFINTCVQALFGHKISTHLDEHVDMQVCSPLLFYFLKKLNRKILHNCCFWFTTTISTFHNIVPRPLFFPPALGIWDLTITEWEGGM